MNVDDALQLPILRAGRIVAGKRGRLRLIKGASVVDHPFPGQEVVPDHLLLTTGYAWPKEEVGLVRLVEALIKTPVSGIAISIPQFFDSVPDAIKNLADEADFPIIEVPWEIPLAKVSEAINKALLRRYGELVDRLELIHFGLTRAATEAKSMPDLVNAIEKLLAREVVIEDLNGGLLGTSSHALALDENSRVRSTSQSPKGPSIRSLIERGYLTPGSDRTALFLPAAPETDLATCVISPVMLNDEVVGVVKVMQGLVPLSDADVRIVEHVATVTALYLSYRRHIEQQELWMTYSFLESVLEGDVTQAGTAEERARRLGILPHLNYQVAVLLTGEQLPLTAQGFSVRERLANRIRQNMVDLGMSALVAPISDRIAVVVQTEAEFVRSLHGLEPNNRRVLLGRLHRGIQGIHRSYQEAISLATVASTVGIHRFEDWLVSRALLGDEYAQEALLERNLTRIQSTREGGVLLQTLDAWVKADFNITETAEALGIHRNTLYYRLDRIAKTLGRDVSDPDMRFELKLSMKLSDLLPRS